MDEKGKIAKAAGSMSGATLISRVLGYARDMLIAFYFGPQAGLLPLTVH